MTAQRFAESVVEAAALAWLESLGWSVRHGLEIVPGETGAKPYAKGVYLGAMFTFIESSAFERVCPVYLDDDEYARSCPYSEAVIGGIPQWVRSLLGRH